MEEIELETRQDLMDYLNKTEYEFVVLKFTADWCNPCKRIAPFIDKLITEKETEFANTPKKFLFIEVNVDVCFDLYAFLKKKKMINGIPCIFLYSKKIYSTNDKDQLYIPQASISGTKEDQIKAVLELIK